MYFLYSVPYISPRLAPFPIISSVSSLTTSSTNILIAMVTSHNLTLQCVPLFPFISFPSHTSYKFFTQLTGYFFISYHSGTFRNSSLSILPRNSSRSLNPTNKSFSPIFVLEENIDPHNTEPRPYNPAFLFLLVSHLCWFSYSFY